MVYSAPVLEVGLPLDTRYLLCCSSLVISGMALGQFTETYLLVLMPILKNKLSGVFSRKWVISQPAGRKPFNFSSEL